MTTGPDLGPLGEGWTATSKFSLATVLVSGFARRVPVVLVSYQHELGGRAVASHSRLDHWDGDGWVLRDARAWTVCIDPACHRVRGYAHTLTEPRRISGDELRWLTTDEVALTL